MNNTPRRGPGGFPATPQQRNTMPSLSTPATSTPASSTPNGSSQRRPNVRSPLAEVPKPAAQTASRPLIPTDILDPASQRFYVFAFYAGLWAWRLYDFYTLAIEEEESLALCLKWCFLDMCFIFGVPLLEIPWLQWSNGSAFILFVVHAVLDGMLMFRIGIPLQAMFLSLIGFMFDSELAISERSVKPGPILHNASLILGKQIINILPEGSAILNPERLSFCLNSSTTHLDLPILINQTEPVEMELLRIDIDTSENETITLKKSELKSLLKRARKAVKHADPAEPLLLRYNVKKTGVYLLTRVLDQSKLQVRPRSSSVVIATCPQARVKPTGDSRCRNDLSNVAIEVEGVPPLSVKYRLIVDDKARGSSDEFHNLQSDESVAPLSRHSSQALVKLTKDDVSWARRQIVKVSLNETLATGVDWEYSIEHVQDGLGNLITFVNIDDDDRPKTKVADIQQSFRVHERPKVYLEHCNAQNPLRVARGDVARLPVHYQSTGKNAVEGPHLVEYLFTPEAELVGDGMHSQTAELLKQTLKTSRQKPLISAAGLYTLKSVATDFCQGEVLEPASCLLQNPPEPELSLSSEDIVDKCAGNPIGLRVSLDLVGSPPFTVTYTEQKKGGASRVNSHQVGSLRGSLDLTPDKAGHYTYTFNSISDAIYRERPVDNLVLQQDVKPPASAHFRASGRPRHACIDDSVDLDVRLIGEGPFKLEYEIVHNGKRNKHSVETAEQHYMIKTPKLTTGGEYTVALVSITDGMGCKDYLNVGEAKIQVRHERPKAYFGHIEGKQEVLALDGRNVDLPIRLTGTGPWRLSYMNLNTEAKELATVSSANSFLGVKDPGTFQLLTVRDAVCPGFIDEKADKFDVSWIARPKISIPESPSLTGDGSQYIKDAVCEGDEDAFDVAFVGNAPYDSAYRLEHKDKRGKIVSVSEKELRGVGNSASIRADTAHAGSYSYTFHKLADGRYDHSKKHFSAVTVQQTVYPRPSARFDKPGKTYSYCSREAKGEDVIPMTLEGVPPFQLEVAIKHAGSPTLETSTHRDIASHKFDLKIEHRKLHLGASAVFIRKIRDSRGCSFKPPPGGPRVMISVNDAPAATALEERTDFCVGERLSFALGGQAPFTVFYTFNGQQKKASNPGTTFRRLAELPGTFTITGLRDSASECLASLELTKEIHAIPSVRLSGGQVSEVDIHEGGVSDLEFSFTGTPPFEFTYTRSTNAAKGRKSKVLEIRTEVSQEHYMRIPVQEEGTYEVVSIKDRWCGFARGGEGAGGAAAGTAQKLLQY